MIKAVVSLTCDQKHQKHQEPAGTPNLPDTAGNSPCSAAGLQPQGGHSNVGRLVSLSGRHPLVSNTIHGRSSTTSTLLHVVDKVGLAGGHISSDNSRDGCSLGLGSLDNSKAGGFLEVGTEKLCSLVLKND